MCSNDKDACISDVVCYQEGGNDRIWNLRFYRDFHERELEAAVSFLAFIQSRIPRGAGSDTSHWCLNGNGKFDTWSYYNNIWGASASNFPWKGVWKVKIPKWVAFFVWTAVHEQILTLDNLRLRRRILVNRCCMCHCNEETVDHLLHCLVAHSLWVICFRSLGSNGSCQALWKAWCIVGAIDWENLIQTYGIWFLAVWCRLFGWKETGTLLRIRRNPWFNYKLYARRLYLIGLGVGASRIALLSWSLFLLFVLHFKFLLVVWCWLFACCISLCSTSWTPCICLL